VQLTRIAVLGAGSIEHAPSVIAALANYFGERPFEVSLWDADEERLDLMCRFARVCCAIMRSQHIVSTAEQLEDVVVDADLVVVLGESDLSDLSDLSDESEMRTLLIGCQSDGKEHLEGWTSNLVDPEPYKAFHQILRWVRSDEYPFEWLSIHENTPLKTWLDCFTAERIESTSTSDGS
jgi:hypothetical protein